MVQSNSAAEGADHLRHKLTKAGNRVKTTDDFIKGIAARVTSPATLPGEVRGWPVHQPTGDGEYASGQGTENKR
jgi:hypothetical protein